jgi:enterochelin esterase-like enzyme
MRTLQAVRYGSALLLLAICASPSHAQQSVGGVAAPGRGGAAAPRVTSPEILPDGRVTFRVQAPKAGEVALNGDWKGGRGIPMTKDAAGLWSVTTAVPPELWFYTFSVDGVTMIDPSNTRVVRDTVNYWSGVLVPGPGSALYQAGKVPHGNVSTVWYPSPALKADRRMTVYTPPGYESSTAKYPVMYLFHGGGGDEECWVEEGVTNVIMDNLIAQGKVKPMIVAMPNANWGEPAALDKGGPRAGRGGQGGAPGGGAQSYDQAVEDIVNGMIPFMEARFRALPGRENRAITGLSMGGGVSINVGLKRLDVFANVGEFSSGMFGGVGGYAPFDVEKISPGFLADPAATNKKLKVFFFSCGTEDPRMQYQTKVTDDLKARKIALTFKGYPGEHDWRVWRASLVDFAQMLFK